jgi:hypothetical protein
VQARDNTKHFATALPRRIQGDYTSGSSSTLISELPFTGKPWKAQMTRTRNRSANRLEIPCPECAQRLWRGCGQKHFIFASNVEQTRALTKTTRKKAILLHSQVDTWVDRSHWIEAFFCSDHGQIWIACVRQADGQVVGEIAPAKLWQQTTGTLDPTKPNPSVSEFTHRSSRGPVA